MPFTIDDLAMVHFFVVVIFTCDPEYRHSFDALVAQTSGELDHRERLVDSVQRSGEQPGLLTRNNCNRAGMTKHLDMLERQLGRTGSPVDSLECIGYPLAIELLSSNAACVIRKRLDRPPVVGVEPRDLWIVVQKIIKQPSRTRDLSEPERIGQPVSSSFKILTISRHFDLRLLIADCRL